MVVTASGIVHAYVPVEASVDATISTGYVRPSSFDSSSFTVAILPTRLHVTSSVSATSQDSNPLGTITLSDPRILNSPSVASWAFGLSTSVTRTLHVADMSSGIDQPYVSVFGVVATICVYEDPEFVEYSSFTLEHAPSVVHVIFPKPFTTHTSPPSGAVIVSFGMIVKSASDSSFTLGSVASDIRTRTVLLTSVGMVHPYAPVPQAVDATISLGAGYVAPLSVEYSSFTFAIEPL